MVADTSIKVYHDIVDSGLVGKLQAEVWLSMREMNENGGPVSGAQVGDYMQTHRGLVYSEFVRNRITENVEQGITEIVGKGLCPISLKRGTPRKTYFYVATDGPPKPRKKKPNFKKICRAIWERFPETRAFIREQIQK
jgi:hypothetical protein